MNAKTVDIKTKDGIAACHFFHPPLPEIRPAVIFYMDEFGIRPALWEMAERLAANGYHVLLPDLYYRSGPTQPFHAATALQDDSERDRLMSLIYSLNQQLVMEDTGSFLDFLAGQPSVARQKTGCIGYSMGGAFALTSAGTFPDWIDATASLYGSHLATDESDSPHRLARAIRAVVYIGIAGIDPYFTPTERLQLESAFQAAGVAPVIEVYPHVKHGFAVKDTPAYDLTASERHWQQILKLFEARL